MSAITTIDTTGMSPKAADRHVSVIKRWEHMKIMAEKAEEKVLSSAEAFGTGLAIGYIEGRYPDKKEVIGFPLAAVVGFGAHAVDLFVPSGYGEHLSNIGNAGFAIAGRDIAAEFGAKKLQEAGGAPRQGSTTVAPASLPAGFTPLRA